MNYAKNTKKCFLHIRKGILTYTHMNQIIENQQNNNKKKEYNKLRKY